MCSHRGPWDFRTPTGASRVKDRPHQNPHDTHVAPGVGPAGGNQAHGLLHDTTLHRLGTPTHWEGRGGGGGLGSGIPPVLPVPASGHWYLALGRVADSPHGGYHGERSGRLIGVLLPRNRLVCK